MGHLILSRQKHEAVIVDGPATIRIISVRGKQVRVGIEAEKTTKVVREELVDSDRRVRE
jgi:carbon storage regulator